MTGMVDTLWQSYATPEDALHPTNLSSRGTPATAFLFIYENDRMAVSMDDIQSVHFIGIGGAGMSATAKLLKDLGVTVTGSDEAVYPPISDFLEQEKLPYHTPYKAENIPDDVDFIVIGKNAKLVPETNEEVRTAIASGKPILSFPEVLGQLAQEKEPVVVAGSYGKSTVTALLAHCLEHAERDPSYFIGAIPYPPLTNAKSGDGEYFIMEGDEYPTSNTDTRSKFLLLHPTHLLLTPLAHDHVNVFPTPESYLEPFTELVRGLPDTGSFVTATSGALDEQFLSSIARSVVTYGVRDGDFHAADIAWGETTTFTLNEKDQSIIEITTSLLGEHNIENVVGVAAFLLTNNILSPEEIQSAIKDFNGIRRRLDKKSDATRIPIYEGFGSSYEKARSAIAAMKLHFPKKRLVVIFEPHTFSWRNRDALTWYDTVFEGAAKVYVYKPAEQGADTHKQLTQEEIVERVTKTGIDTEAISDPATALGTITQETTEDDVILLLTSGELGGLIKTLPNSLAKVFPSS